MSRTPTQQLQAALDDLCRRNAYPGRVREMWLGPGLFVALITEPVVIEGECWDVEPREMDIFKLMEEWGRGMR
jgi:hypothetical protein